MEKKYVSALVGSHSMAPRQKGLGLKGERNAKAPVLPLWLMKSVYLYLRVRNSHAHHQNMNSCQIKDREVCGF